MTKMIRVSGWDNSRHLIEEGGKILFELMNLDCDCAQCHSRKYAAQRTLIRKGVPYSLRELPTYRGVSVFVELDLPPEGKAAEVYVGELLDLTLTIHTGRRTDE